MWGIGKWRERRLHELRTRQECLELRYIFANWHLDPARSLSDLDVLLLRVRAATGDLRPIINAHGNSPARWAKFGVGVVATGLGLVGISTPLGLASAGMGVALIIEEGRSIAQAELLLQQDMELLNVLGRMQHLIIEELKLRGVRTPPHS